ncbi:S-methyl-5'-thioadenosine phosphorylase [Acanthopleuribacter pedis]|uniref:S-methyl-5'-thioadenosine phosphorylase n=1 Tax=Acanthopleuribacter pedis TaxID=442870 RepID=A0A8J7Q6E7_9BACT|nr:S-methyl-5'-thioadenosine phosphorylase [Acanthopleuribacter pedis]MBO1318976.1 S-methyl-5'-thioadenosine phosphorylase [Acanthopleuribacter pedis]
MATLEKIDIGIVGGSGFYNMEELTDRREVEVETPYGKPSDSFLVGRLGGKTVAFLARHNRKHHILPTELNFRANIYAFKQLGARYLISASAVGSLKEAYAPTHFVFPDQFIDRTRHRVDTFFGEGIVAHVSLAEPICTYLQKTLYNAAREIGVNTHLGGTYVNMEGPQFSTRAESFMYRSWDADVIGMTNLQEAKLAREAEIPYATIAMVTDYDCWHEEEEHVTVDMVVKILRQNAEAAAATIAKAVTLIDLDHVNPIHEALKFSILTQAENVPAERKQALAAIIGKYMDTDS